MTILVSEGPSDFIYKLHLMRAWKLLTTNRGVNYRLLKTLYNVNVKKYIEDVVTYLDKVTNYIYEDEEVFMALFKSAVPRFVE